MTTLKVLMLRLNAQWPRKRRRGFTIVELLIVIVVIAILAAITIVAYNGIQSRARNTIRQDELTKWAKLFMGYKAINGNFPTMTINQEYCLGSGYPVGYGNVARCHNYLTSTGVLESDNASLMAALQTIGTLPSNDRTPLSGGLVGPYVSVGSTGVISLTMTYEGTVCPSGTTQYWSDGSSRATCVIQVQ